MDECRDAAERGGPGEDVGPTIIVDIIRDR